MDYLEAIAIKRLRPDSLPGNIAHLPAEADRVINRHKALCRAGDSPFALELPVLAENTRERANAVLLFRLSLACGLLEPWGGERMPLRASGDTELIDALQRRPGPKGRAARAGGAAHPMDRIE